MSGWIAGVDEAGRGPLAGPVYAAAVILDPNNPIEGLKDSKKLTERARTRLASQIKEQALAWSIAYAEVEEIDRINILQASLLAMQRAVAGLSIIPTQVLVDGNQIPLLAMPAQALIGGDDIEPAISAASILAKVTRDEIMIAMEAKYPGYGFAGHKGYPTAAHRRVLEELGPCAIHRKSFAPVARLLEEAY